MTGFTSIGRRPALALALGSAFALAAATAEARITRIEITSVQSPTFEGRTFGPDGAVGAYEKLRGKAYGELDPNDPRNAVITDIELAPRVNGKVQYSMDIYILKPINLADGNGKLFMEVNNRGGKLLTARNMMLTMLLGGLWHGAAWTFVIWGLYQGAVLVVARAIQRWAARAGVAIPRGLTAARVLLALLMFQVTCYGWLIFRAQSVDQLARFTRLLFTDLAPTAATWQSLFIPMLTVVAPLLAVHAYQAHRGAEEAPMRLPLVARYSLYVAVFYAVLLWGDFEGAQFIYFQF